MLGTFCPSRVAWSLVALVLVGAALCGLDEPASEKLREAVALEQAGELDRSMAVYRQVAQENPHSLPAYVGMGRLHLRAKRYREAAASFEQALRLAPGEMDVLEGLGKSYLGAGEPAKVLDLLTPEKVAAEKRARVHLLRARAYDAQDKTAEAAQELRAALALDPQYPGAHFALGFLAWTGRDLAAAEEEFKKELAARPRHRLSQYYLAEVLMTQAKFDDANRVLEKMAKDWPECYLTHLGSGKLAERTGDYPRAAEWFRTAVSIDPQQMEAHYHLGRVYGKLGESAKAAEELELANRLRRANPLPMQQGMGGVRARLPELD